MNFDPSEDQAMLKAGVERCLAGLGERRESRRHPHGFAPADWQALATAGVLGLPVSAANGGMGAGHDGDRPALLMAMEAIGRGLVAAPVLDAAVIAGSLLDATATAPAHLALLAGLVAGTRLPVLAHAERAARHDLSRVETTANPRGDGFLLEGRKIAVMAGAAADSALVSARTGDAVGIWVVALAAPGVTRRAYRIADGSVAAEIELRGVAVSATDRLADVAALAPVIAVGRAAAAAEMLGLMTLLFDATLAYVKTRQQFGKPLGAFQVIQHRLVEAYARVELARAQVLRAALAPAGEFAAVAAGAKAYVTEAALAVAQEAVQLHGGMGITDELAIGHALKRIRVLALCLGDSTAALDDYARAA